MSSLALRLLCGTTLAVALVLGLAGVALYRLVERSLVEEVDRALVAKARLLASAVEVDEGELELEFESFDMWEFGATERGWFLEVRRDGQDAPLFRSASLAATPLEPVPDTRPTWTTLAGGARARALTLAFHPRAERRRDRERGLPTLTLTMARDTSTVDRTLTTLWGSLAGVGVAALLATGLALTIVVRRSLRPLGALCDRIAAIDARDLTARLDAARVPDELLPVVQRTNDLLSRLDGAFARERAFSNDVAHELRTPLSGLRALLEVTAARPRDEADYARALREGTALVDQLQSMVERLLQLARLEAGVAPLAPERVDVADLLLETWDAFAARAAARGLRVDWQLGEDLALTTDRGLLIMIARNLLENAVTYADERGQVRVTARREGERVTLEVRNTGSALGPEDAARATQRFWRGSAARSEAGVHCGLGLSLVEKATHALGGRLELAAQQGGEFVATVRV